MENLILNNDLGTVLQKKTKLPEAASIEGLGDIEDVEKFTVKLDIFEGHFDALLDMIEEKKVGICDISLTDLTGQYLNYLSLAQGLNLSLASEFMAIAAYLMEQKSRMLLPKEEEAAEEEEKIESSLVDHLMQYNFFKKIAESLKQKKEFFSKIFHRAKIDAAMQTEKHYVLKDVGVDDLVSAFKKVWLEVKSRGEQFEIVDEVVTVGEKIAEIQQMLSSAAEGVHFESLFRTKTRLEVIVTFLALLEMIRSKAVAVKQEQLFGSIMIFSQRTEAK